MEIQIIEKTRSSSRSVEMLDASGRDSRSKSRSSIPIALKDTFRSASAAARVAEVDYTHNGARCRASSGDFIGPRWVPDQEVSNCSRCSSLFDWTNRRHHCRHCGNIFCDKCSPIKAMLPMEYGQRDPQRVCIRCASTIAPLQESLIQSFANHNQSNIVDLTTTGIRRYLNLPFSSTLSYEIRKAAFSVSNILRSHVVRDKSFTLQLLQRARGVAFLTVVKAGMLFAARMGTGLVISRLPNGQWSAPSAIATIGFSWGALIGADLVDYAIILGNDAAVDAFSGVGQATVGAEMDIALGPLGRAGGAEINLGDTGAASTYTYSQSRGLFAGLSLDGAVILSRPDLNHRFYGRAIEPRRLLRGDVPPPTAAGPLYDALTEALQTPTLGYRDLKL
eukprot:gene11037-23069_t